MNPLLKQTAGAVTASRAVHRYYFKNTLLPVPFLYTENDCWLSAVLFLLYMLLD
jgi:hypothetical protein